MGQAAGSLFTRNADITPRLSQITEPGYVTECVIDFGLPNQQFTLSKLIGA